jgi:hypothetical protein
MDLLLSFIKTNRTIMSNNKQSSIDKEFVPYEEALALKELGYNEPCFGFYFLNGNEFQLQFATLPSNHEFKDSPFKEVAVPTFSQAFRWFREKYNLRGFIGFRPNVKQFDHHIYDMSLSGIEYTKQRTMEEYNKDPLVGTYEEAELECLRKLIEIANEKLTDSTRIPK